MDDLLTQNLHDTQRIAQLEQTVAQLQETVAELFALVDTDEAVDVRKITKTEAKKEIKKYFEDHHGKKLYPSDVAIELRLDYDLVTDVISALVKSRDVNLA